MTQNTTDSLSVETTPTRRITVPALEALLEQAIPVLDHGFVRLVDYMGDDHAIVQAARVSYGRGTAHRSQNKALINYLMRHQHTTPFEMCEIKLHIKLPIFIARQWIRHRTASINEYSARYSILDREFYMPETAHMAAQSETNNQGRGKALAPEDANAFLKILHDDAHQCYNSYQKMLNLDDNDQPLDADAPSLARELARMNLTLNYYTQWYWKINLHNLLHFLRLRADPHAQYEIRAYAEAILEIVKAWVPMAYDAFMQYHRNGARLSQAGLDTVRRMLQGESVTQENSGMGVREWQEFTATISPSTDNN